MEAKMLKPAKQHKTWAQKVATVSNIVNVENMPLDPKEIALSIHDNCRHNKNKKITPLQSAMAEINFYINRAGHNLNTVQKHTLVQAKDELRALFREERVS